jgi:hypothetical protein
MISDDSIDRALDWLRDNAVKAAKSKAERVYAEEYRKSLKATLMAHHKDKAIGVQEREAYSHPDYLAHLQAIKEAVQADEYNRWQMVAAQARIEAWRSMQANQRIQAGIR